LILTQIIIVLQVAVIGLSEVMMSNKHFCQGTNCHTNPTQDRFLKSRGVIRGRYAYSTMDKEPNQWGWKPSIADTYFCSQGCKIDWLNHNMENIEHGRPIEFIRHRRESQGYRKVTDDTGYRSYTTIERVDNNRE
jgi:hypothetical protein